MMDFAPGEYVWQQVLREMRRRIAAGEYRPGYPIPGAPRLAAEFGVARRTAQRVLDVLKESGEVYTLTGKGTFVTKREEDL
jgi:DNA-binding GntR family transcriptional regulator